MERVFPECAFPLQDASALSGKAGKIQLTVKVNKTSIQWTPRSQIYRNNQNIISAKNNI